MLSDRNPLVISRQLLGLFAAEIGRLSPDVLKVRAGGFCRRVRAPCQRETGCVSIQRSAVCRASSSAHAAAT